MPAKAASRTTSTPPPAVAICLLALAATYPCSPSPLLRDFVNALVNPCGYQLNRQRIH